MQQPHGQPLAGIRVLDFSHVLAGPFCTRLLCDLGADVVRIESSRRVDSPWRSASDSSLKRTYAYVMTHRGKRSVTLDLKSAEGSELARRFASVADVVVENFSAGVMERLRLSYERLQPHIPRLIYLSMSGYGHDGPRKDWTSMNSNLQAYSGLMMVTDTEAQPPVAISNSWMDYVGGLHGCFAVLRALDGRRESGVGCNIDLAQFECGVSTLGPLLLAAMVHGDRPERIGSRSAQAAPQGCYSCAGEDQWCAISVEGDAQWGTLAAALNHPAWITDLRFATLAGRLLHHDEIDARIEAWTETLPPVEVERRLRSHGIAAERMRRVDEILGGADSVFHFETGASGKTRF